MLIDKSLPLKDSTPRFNEYALRMIRQVNDDSSVTELERKEAIRVIFQEGYKEDFGAFVFLLGYKDIGAFHRPEIDKIAEFRHLESQIRRLWLWSRGFFKTSLITEAHTLWLIVNNPNIRVLIVSFSLEVAKKPLGAIRNFLATNDNFRYFFREFCPQANKEGKVEFGTTEAFTVCNRTRALKEPTVMCAGVGTNITGLHFDAMKIDDLVNKDSVTNDTQLQSSKDYYSLLRPIFDNPTIPREDVVGTIYHFNDLHSDLQTNPSFQKSVIPSYTEEGFTFPERLDKEGWDKMVSDPSINPYDIQRQWLLRPINPKDAKFKEEWIKYYDTLPEGMSEYITVDPASTQKKKSDYTVIERWGVDSEGNQYLLEAIRDKLTSFQRIDKLFQFVANSKLLRWVKYEVIGGRHGDLEVISERQRNTNVFFLVKETKSTNASKVDRIEQRLVGPYHAGIIYLPRTLIYKSEFDSKAHNFTQDLKLELIQFPFTEHDDCLDCQSQMFEEHTILGNKPRVVAKELKVTADMEDAQYEKIKREMKSHPFATENWAKNRIKNRLLRRIMAR